VNTTLIGETAAKLMDGLGDRDGAVVAVAIVTVIDQDDEQTYTRAEFSSDRLYEQLGLMHAGLSLIHDGAGPDDDEPDD
jgi:hypothetical protein